jgi:histone H1/5
MGPKEPPAHPPFADMFKEAILSEKSRKGSTLPFLKKFLKSHYNLGEALQKKTSQYLRQAVSSGKIVKDKVSPERSCFRPRGGPSAPAMPPASGHLARRGRVSDAADAAGASPPCRATTS